MCAWRWAGKPVLRGIDWRIRPGQRWVLIGPNGSGKTQLLKLLAGDVWPSPAAAPTRRYHFRGECFEDPYGIKQEIAYLGAERQDRYEHYAWNHRVEAIVGTGLHRTDIPLAALTPPARQQVGRLLRRLRIEALAHRRFLTLSYGERRLVLLARALAWRPKLLLLDEPFNGLDAVNRERVQHCLSVLSRSSLPWVLASHRAEDIPRPRLTCAACRPGVSPGKSAWTHAIGAYWARRSRLVRRVPRRRRLRQRPATPPPTRWSRCAVRRCGATVSWLCATSRCRFTAAIAGWCTALTAVASRALFSCCMAI
jgi:ABC-type molybdenum transport system ATPase subunit/photorepair protein PhrA